MEGDGYTNMIKGKYKATVYREPSEIETIYFEPSWHDPHVVSQSVAVAAIENREMSMVLLKIYGGKYPASFMNFVFTEEETKALIEALLEVKHKWVKEA